MTALLTSHLSLDPLRLEDASDLSEMRGDPDVMAFWDWPADSNAEMTRSLVAGMIQQASAGRAMYWTLRLRVDGTFVGLCDLSDLQTDSADIGFMLARRHWGLGLAHEAVMAVLDHARAIGLRTICARVHDRNERSVRLLERAGFVEAGLLRDFEIRPDVFRDCRSFRKTF
jgi:RimJ/RimL family protein N-acetyltransferase